MDRDESIHGVTLTSAPIGNLAKALATAQGAFTVPTKGHTAKVKMKNGGEYTYTYSTLDDLIAATRPALAANGLSVIQDVEVSPRSVSVWTIIAHGSGEQWRSGAVVLAVGGDGRPQDVGSAITYARRYSMGAALNVAADEDDDAAAAQQADKPKATKRDEPKAKAAPPPDDYITHQQKDALIALGKSLGWPKDDYFRVLRQFGAETTSDLRAEQFDDFKHALETGVEGAV